MDADVSMQLPRGALRMGGTPEPIMTTEHTSLPPILPPPHSTPDDIWPIEVLLWPPEINPLCWAHQTREESPLAGIDPK